MFRLFRKEHNAQLALFIVRVTLGSIFIIHGGQKIFGWFGGDGYDSFVNWTTSIGANPWLAKLAPYFEFIGGLFLVLGFLPELGALMVIAVMIGAIYFVHWGKGYFVDKGGLEYALNLILFALAILIGGPGKFALLHACGKERYCGYSCDKDKNCDVACGNSKYQDDCCKYDSEKSRGGCCKLPEKK